MELAEWELWVVNQAHSKCPEQLVLQDQQVDQAQLVQPVHLVVLLVVQVVQEQVLSKILSQILVVLVVWIQ